MNLTAQPSASPSLIQRWRRRWWRKDAIALARFAALTPAVVVTGASEGIGLAFAKAYARAGRNVVLIARNAHDLEVAAASLVRDDVTGVVATLALDVTAADAPARLDAKLAASGAYVDILVNNAGMGLSGDFAGQPPEAIESLLALNVGALTRLSRHVLPDQLVRGRGGIINIASVGGYLPGPQQAVYYASKAYVISLSEALAAETAGRGVLVMAVAPGVVETAFHTKMGANASLLRMILPAHSPRKIVASALIGFYLGHRVVVPGLLNRLIVLAVRALPHRAVAPLVGLLLRPEAQPLTPPPHRPPSE